MRSITYALKAFKAQLVANTNKLVSSETLTVAQKLAAINQAIEENEKKLATLRSSREKSDEPTTVEKLDRFVELREGAAKYLESMKKWVVTNNNHSLTIRQRPRLFAVPAWQSQDDPPAKAS